MCGFCGILTPKNLNRHDLLSLARMNRALRHRGPDDEGYVLLNGTSVELRGSETIAELGHFPLLDGYSPTSPYRLGLGHRRLSIIDVTERGHQPMHDPEHDLWIAYNGEIYNYIEIRDRLKGLGHTFHTDTDTEVILKAYQQWGTDCLQRFNGIWAFVIWDSAGQELFCSRDRFGVKPFYYSLVDGDFLFASEIKSILQHSNVQARANSPIVWDYLMLSLIDHTEETFFDKIFQLLPGHYLIVDAQGRVQTRKYYDLPLNDETGSFSNREASRLSSDFLDLLDDAVKIRLRSDVSVASYLSGGMDSSAILSLIDRHTSQLPYDFKTFSAVYDDSRFDERPFITEALKGKKVSPFFFKPQPELLESDISELIYSQEEPFISTAIYAQYTLLKNIKKHGLKVLLTGDGADEVLCGYPYPYLALFLLDLLKELRLSRYCREIRGLGLKQGMLHTAKGLYWLLPSALRVPIRKKFRIKPRIMNQDFYHEFLWREKKWMDILFRASVQKRLHLDMTRFLLPHELRFREKNAMAFSIEERQPFLDYRLVELCYSVPAVYKIHDGWRKYLLRLATDTLLPPSIQWRKTKLGFGSSELRWYFDSIRLPDEIDFLAGNYINRKMMTEFAGNISFSNAEQVIELWSFYNLELWMREFRVTS